MVQVRPSKTNAVAWRGTTTILAGNETVTVTHGLGYAPTVDKIIPTLQGDSQGYSAWADTPTTTTFILHFGTIVMENKTFNVVILR